MKKKIVIGSIGVVIIIILVSFTTVVGFQNTDLSKVGFSPLFRIRTKNSIDDDIQEIIESNYLGKNSNNIIPFSIDTSKNRMIQTMITRIKKMDTTEFSALKQTLLQKCREDSKLHYQLDFIEHELEKIRNNPELLKIHPAHQEDKYSHFIDIDDSWYPGFILDIILNFLIMSLFIFLCFVFNPPTA